MIIYKIEIIHDCGINDMFSDFPFFEMEKFTQEVLFSFDHPPWFFTAELDCRNKGYKFNEDRIAGITFLGDNTTCLGKLSKCIKLGEIEGGCLSVRTTYKNSIDN